MNNEELISIFNFLKEHFPENFEELFTSFDFFIQNLSDIKNLVSKQLSQQIAEGKYDNELFYSVQKVDNLLKELFIVEKSLHVNIEQQISMLSENSNVVDNHTTSNIYINKQDENQISKINYNNYKVDNDKEHYISEDFTNKRPYAFSFQNSSKIKIANWKEMYFLICEILLKKNSETFTNLRFILKGKKCDYIAYNSSDMLSAKKLSNGLFIETNFSALDLARNIKIMLTEYGINENELKIYLNADYTSLHQ